MKKILVLATLFSLIFAVDCFAANISNDITDKTMDRSKNVGNIPREDDGKWKYPLVGSRTGGGITYHLDTSSCTYWTSGNVATAACIVYMIGRGIAPMNFQFDTYKSKNGRKIFLKSIKIVNGAGNTEISYWLEQDNGFLLSLFWKVSKYSGLSKYLD